MTSATIQPDTTSETAVVPRFLQALASRDFETVESLLAPDLWLRVLLPREIRQHHTAAEGVEALRGWYADAEGFEPLELDHDPSVGLRHRLRYRFRLKPGWAPERWHRIEQGGLAKVENGRIRRLDLVCSGFLPEEDRAAPR